MGEITQATLIAQTFFINNPILIKENFSKAIKTVQHKMFIDLEKINMIIINLFIIIDLFKNKIIEI